MSVVLPAPFAPSRPTTSPASTCIDTSSTARTSPKRRDTDDARSKVVVMPPPRPGSSRRGTGRSRCLRGRGRRLHGRRAASEPSASTRGARGPRRHDHCVADGIGAVTIAAEPDRTWSYDPCTRTRPVDDEQVRGPFGLVEVRGGHDDRGTTGGGLRTPTATGRSGSRDRCRCSARRGPAAPAGGPSPGRSRACDAPRRTAGSEPVLRAAQAGALQELGAAGASSAPATRRSPRRSRRSGSRTDPPSCRTTRGGSRCPACRAPRPRRRRGATRGPGRAGGSSCPRRRPRRPRRPSRAAPRP